MKQPIKHIEILNSGYFQTQFEGNIFSCFMMTSTTMTPMGVENS